MRRRPGDSHACGHKPGERIDCLVSNVIRSLRRIDPTTSSERGGPRGARQQLVDTLDRAMRAVRDDAVQLINPDTYRSSYESPDEDESEEDAEDRDPDLRVTAFGGSRIGHTQTTRRE